MRGEAISLAHAAIGTLSPRPLQAVFTMLHPDTELRYVSDAIGYGVFATRPIPRGTIVWARDAFDRAFSVEQVQVLGPLHRKILDKYGYRDGRGDIVLCWDHARFVNHSCEATLLAPGWDFEIAVVDIAAGQEVTDDYGTLGLEEPFTCLCGSASCRETVSPDDVDALMEQWDKRARAALAFTRVVAQPLWELVRNRDEVERALAGMLPIPSCRVHQPPRKLRSLAPAV